MPTEMMSDDHHHHVEGMLDRDQRTAKIPQIRCYRVACQWPPCVRGSFVRTPSKKTSECRCGSATSFPRTSKFRPYLHRTIQKLKNVLVVSAYLTLLAFPSSSPAPLALKMCDKPQNGPRWINPCNLSGTAQEIRDQPVENLNVTLLTPIVVSARQTLDLANNLKENYAKVIFKQGAAQVENLLRDQKYNWLPQLPDTRDERAFRDHAKALPWQRALLESYKYLQTIAVGLEQVTSDFENDPIDSMKENFTEINNHVHNVLCELQMSIIDHNLKIERDVGRDAMPQMYREICESRSRRSERDWIILRECINVLEYTIGVFTHLSN